MIEQYAGYQDLLTHLPEDIQTLWQEKLEESSWYEPTLEKLLYFIDYKVLRYCQQQVMLLQRHQEIKMVTYGEFMKPNKIDMDLLYYEQFLDKKFEKILAMLLKLKTLTCNEVVKKTNATSIPEGSDETNEY